MLLLCGSFSGFVSSWWQKGKEGRHQPQQAMRARVLVKWPSSSLRKTTAMYKKEVGEGKGERRRGSQRCGPHKTQQSARKEQQQQQQHVDYRQRQEKDEPNNQTNIVENWRGKKWWWWAGWVRGFEIWSPPPQMYIRCAAVCDAITHRYTYRIYRIYLLYPERSSSPPCLIAIQSLLHIPHFP